MIVKLIIKLSVFVSVILCLSYATLHIYPDYKKEYVAGIIPKMEKLKSIKIKKIVIIGGSNAAFGIDSDLMERQLKIPVVNMGLHAGLPTKYLFEQVKPYLNKEDILILTSEYDSFIGGHRWANMNGTEVPKVATYDFSGVRAIISDRTLFETTTTSIFNTIKLYIKTYPLKGNKDTTSVYSLKAFKNDNLFERFINGEYKKEAVIQEHKLPIPNKNSLTINELKKYKQYFDNQGVNFYLTPPVIVKGFYKENEISSFWEFLQYHTKIAMLNDEKNYTYDKQYFLNTHYHTNYKGRKLRTKSLIKDIVNKGLGEKKLGKQKLTFVCEEDIINNANLDSINSLHNFKIKRNDSNQIYVKQKGDLAHNYLRMSFQKKDYKNYNFYMHLECNKNVINNIKFRGTGLLENFDTINDLGNNNYHVWKKMGKVLWKDGNSYTGISYPNNESLKDSEFVVKSIGIYKDFGHNSVRKDNYDIRTNDIKDLFFEIVSSESIVYLNDIVKSKETPRDLKLEPNKLYKIDTINKTIVIRDFYNDNIIFKTKNMISFKNSPNSIIKVYE